MAANIIPFILKPVKNALSLDKDFSLLTVGGRVKDLISKAVDEEAKAEKRHIEELGWLYKFNEHGFAHKNDWKAVLTEMGSKLKDERHERVASTYKLQLFLYHGMCFLNELEADELTSESEERYVRLPELIKDNGNARFLIVRNGKCYESKKPARDYLVID